MTLLRLTSIAALLALALLAPIDLNAARLAVINADTFTDTNGTSLDAHTPTTGGGWSESVFTVWEIQSNTAKEVGSGSGWAYAVVESSDASVAVDVDIAIPNVSDYAYSITVRWTNNTNHWRADVLRTSSGTPLLRIVEVNAGSETTRDSDTIGAVSGTTINLKITTNSDTIEGYIDDALTSSYASASFNNTATIHGIALFTGFERAGSFDNFSIDSDPGGGGGAASFVPAIINAPVRGGGIRQRLR
jgi:hypothetical protein